MICLISFEPNEDEKAIDSEENIINREKEMTETQKEVRKNNDHKARVLTEPLSVDYVVVIKNSSSRIEESFWQIVFFFGVRDD